MSNRWQELPINPSPKVGNAKHVGLLLSMLHPATLLFVEVKPCRFLFLREPEKEETKASNTASGPKRKQPLQEFACRDSIAGFRRCPYLGF